MFDLQSEESRDVVINLKNSDFTLTDLPLELEVKIFDEDFTNLTKDN